VRVHTVISTVACWPLCGTVMGLGAGSLSWQNQKKKENLIMRYGYYIVLLREETGRQDAKKVVVNLVSHAFL
jgi:hypothetical protein